MPDTWYSKLQSTALQRLHWGQQASTPQATVQQHAPPRQQSKQQHIPRCTLSAPILTLLISLCVLLLVGFIICVAWVLPYKVLQGPPAATHLISVTYTGQLERDCRPLYISGFNAPDLIEASLVNATLWPQLGAYGRAQVLATFRAAAAEGLNVVRTWTHTLSEAYAFQVAPGIYNPAGLEALDYVLAAAKAAGLQVILCFADNWGYYNGVDQYVDWSSTAPNRTMPLMPPDPRQSFSPATMFQGDPTRQAYEAKRHALFFSDTGARQLFRAHIATMIKRVNSITGVSYSSDPTILAWELLNEPRCEVGTTPECNSWVQSWVQEMAAFVKSLDSNHLLGLGLEGFFAAGSPNAHLNPVPWAGKLGVDWVTNNALAEIDVAMLHVWPENWEVEGRPGFSAQWLSSHLEVAATQLPGKPVLLAEFGKRIDATAPDNSVSQLALLGSYGLAAAAAAAAADAVAAEAAVSLGGNATGPAYGMTTNGTGGVNASTPADAAAAAAAAVQQQRQGLPLYLLRPSAADTAAARDPAYAAVYASASQAMSSQTPLAGVLFWQLQIPAGQHGAGEYGLSWDDSTMDSVRAFSNLTRRMTNSMPPNSNCLSRGVTGTGTTTRPQQQDYQQQGNASSGCFVALTSDQNSSQLQQSDVASNADLAANSSTCTPAPGVCSAYWAIMGAAAAEAAWKVAAATNGRELSTLVAESMAPSNASTAAALAESMQATQRQLLLQSNNTAAPTASTSNAASVTQQVADVQNERMDDRIVVLITYLAVVAGVGSSPGAAAEAISGGSANGTAATATNDIVARQSGIPNSNVSQNSSSLAASRWVNATNAAAESASNATLQALEAAAAAAPQHLQQLQDIVMQQQQLQQAWNLVSLSGTAVASQMPVLQQATQLVAAASTDGRRQLRRTAAVSDSSMGRARQLLSTSSTAHGSITNNTAPQGQVQLAAQVAAWQLTGIPLALGLQQGFVSANMPHQQVDTIHWRADSTDTQQQQQAPLTAPAAAELFVLPLAALLEQPPAGLTEADIASAAEILAGRMSVFTDLAQCQATDGM